MPRSLRLSCGNWGWGSEECATDWYLTLSRIGVGMPLNSQSSSRVESSTAHGDKPLKSRKGCGCIVLCIIILFFISFCSKSPKNVNNENNSNTPVSELSDSNREKITNQTPRTDLASGDIAIVSTKKVRGRSEPNSNARTIDTLRSGEKVRILSRKGNWVKVAKGATSVWIVSTHVKRRSSSPNLLKSSSFKKQSSDKSTKAKKRRVSRKNGYYSTRGTTSGSCPCNGGPVCVGPRGGRYCITSSGNKRYGV
jgi:hypothetical protein